MPDKIDSKKVYKDLYFPKSGKVSLVNVPAMNFAMIDGAGDPNNSTDFADAIQALYSVSYTLKFIIKKSEPEKDYVVAPLEALWWGEYMECFDVERKADWLWTVMIMQPDYITNDMISEAMEKLAKKEDLKALPKVRFEVLEEGASVQTLYIGPYSEEGPTIQGIFDFMNENGYSPRGKHHEIYMSDPRKVAPEKLKTVIRHPVIK